MSEHTPVDTHLPEATALNALDSLRFEKAELNAFVLDDRDTGAKIGKMLALIFCILVVMMGGVAWWTFKNQFTSQDPMATPASTAKTAGH